MAGNHWPSHSHDDPRWTAVDAYTIPHSHPAPRPNAKVLENVLKLSTAAGLPDYSLSPAQAKFLALHCRASGVTLALEVGTLGGYSAIWVASETHSYT
jgi:predicted O-methyltransferase YrrM